MSKTVLKRQNFNVSLKILPYLGFFILDKKLVMLQDFSRIVVRMYVCILWIIIMNDLCKSGSILISTELLQLVNLGMTWPFWYEEHTFLTRISIFIVNSAMQDFSFWKTCKSWVKKFMDKFIWGRFLDHEFKIAGKLPESSIFLATSESSWLKNTQHFWKSHKNFPRHILNINKVLKNARQRSGVPYDWAFSSSQSRSVSQLTL